MKNIALICALPVLSNSGMLSVDLAFETVKNYIPDCNVVRFSAEEINRPGSIPIVYKKLTSIDQLESFDLIIYWGDFMQWIKYGPTYIGNAGLKTYSEDNNISLETAKLDTLNNWYKLFLLEGRIDLQKKTIIFGSTLCGLDSVQISNNRYRDALISLYKNSKTVLMRDIVSAHFNSQLLETNNMFYGCDCALLFDPLVVPEPTILPLSKSNYFVYSFGRSNLNLELEELCLEISKHTGIKAVKISWLDPKLSVDSLLKNLAIIRNSKFAITDIYHFSVNSWRENVPTLTFGRASVYPSQGTLPDKKKEIFNTQIFAMNYYQYLEDFEKKFIIEVDKSGYAGSCVKKILKQDASKIFETINYQKTCALTGLIDCINK
jgi:hypothetical protein